MNDYTIRRAYDKFCYILISISLISLCGVSCSSLQSDRMLSLTDAFLEAELTDLTLIIVPLDRNPDPENIQNARAFINELEKKKIEDTLFRARLSAWSGRLFLIEGLKKSAEKSFSIASNLVSNDPAVTVLSSRLESSPEKKFALLEKGRALTDDTAIIDIEKGRTLCELGRWGEAVAAFDTAFAKLSLVYRETYADEREKAWNLRAVNSQLTLQTAEVAAKQMLLWKDAISMIQSETSLFSFITGDAVWTTEKIANSLYDKNLIPQKENKTSFLETSFLRSDAAYFLWHLHSQWQGKPALLNRYSARYKNMKNPVSPIQDIDLSDVFFDSVLGCIEWEFMALPDGKNFRPNDSVKGTTFLHMIQKIEEVSRTTF